MRVHPWFRKIPWRRAWKPTPVFLPGESHGRKSLAGYSPWGRESQTQLSDQTTAAVPPEQGCLRRSIWHLWISAPCPKMRIHMSGNQTSHLSVPQGPSWLYYHPGMWVTQLQEFDWRQNQGWWAGGGPQALKKCSSSSSMVIVCQACPPQQCFLWNISSLWFPNNQWNIESIVSFSQSEMHSIYMAILYSKIIIFQFQCKSAFLLWKDDSFFTVPYVTECVDMFRSEPWLLLDVLLSLETRRRKPCPGDSQAAWNLCCPPAGPQGSPARLQKPSIRLRFGLLRSSLWLRWAFEPWGGWVRSVSIKRLIALKFCLLTDLARAHLLEYITSF